MRISMRQLFFLFAGLVFCGQVLAGPLFVCEEMRGSASSTGHEQPAHVHEAGPTGHHQQDDQSVDADHECQQSPCGLCLATTPFVTLPQNGLSAAPSASFQSAHIPGHPTFHTDIPFRPPIVA